MGLAKRKEGSSEVRVVVEVDGNPVGFLSLDMNRLWPIINRKRQQNAPADWIDHQRFQTAMKATVVQNMIHRLQRHLYQSLGREIVKAELDAESFSLKADAAAETFGRKRKDVEALAARAGRTPAEFYAFFWEHLLSDQEYRDLNLKKMWKAYRKA